MVDSGVFFLAYLSWYFFASLELIPVLHCLSVKTAKLVITVKSCILQFAVGNWLRKMTLGPFKSNERSEYSYIGLGDFVWFFFHESLKICSRSVFFAV